MRITESYFANLKNLGDSVEPISVSLYVPSWYSGKTCKSLAPTEEILRAYKSSQINIEQYIEHYYEDVLSKYSVENILWSFENMGGGKDIALVCYEKAGVFCHRHLILMWLYGKSVEDMKRAFVK